MLEENVDLATPFPSTEPLDFVRASRLLVQQPFPARLLSGDTLAQRFMGSKRICPGSETVEHDVAGRLLHRQLGFLRQVTNRGLPPPRNAALVGRVDADENARKGGFAGAVGPNEPHTLAFVNRQVDSIEQRNVPVRLPQILSDQNGHAEG